MLSRFLRVNAQKYGGIFPVSINRSTPTSMTHLDWLDRADTIQRIHTIPTFRRLFIVIKKKNNGGNIEIILTRAPQTGNIRP